MRRSFPLSLCAQLYVVSIRIYEANITDITIPGDLLVTDTEGCKMVILI